MYKESKKVIEVEGVEYIRKDLFEEVVSYVDGLLLTREGTISHSNILDDVEHFRRKHPEV